MALRDLVKRPVRREFIAIVITGYWNSSCIPLSPVLISGILRICGFDFFWDDSKICKNFVGILLRDRWLVDGWLSDAEEEKRSFHQDFNDNIFFPDETTSFILLLNQNCVVSKAHLFLAELTFS